MENNIEEYKEEKIKNNNKNIIKIVDNSFIKFLEEYYGHFKQFISFDKLYQIGKVSHKLLSLFIIDKGNKLYQEKESKIKKLKRIISLVRTFIKINFVN